MTMSSQNMSTRDGAGSSERRRVMVSVAPNGGRKTKADHPALPISATELARCAAECRDAGASLIHVHVRDAEGSHSLDADAYKAVTRAIRREVGNDLVVQITTDSLGRFSPSDMIAAVQKVRPEAASIALREIVRNEADERHFAGFMRWMSSEGVAPQIILYDQRDQQMLKALQDRGLVSDRIPLLYVLGRYTANQTSDPADLTSFLDAKGPPHWSVCAFGPREAECVVAASLLGGNARIGFENNLLLPSGEIAPSNAASVAVVASALGSLSIPLETADGLRETLSRLQ
jgi:3-keto-5-aminohexanoate cleavage enzyme